MVPKYLLVCSRDNVGENLAFHANEGFGYTTNLNNAHTYSKREALAIKETLREFEYFVELEKALEFACWKVDSQLVMRADKSISGPYLMYRNGMWSGNDLYFFSKSGSLNLDVNEAMEFLDFEEDRLKQYSYVALSDVAKIKQPTVHFELANQLKVDF